MLDDSLYGTLLGGNAASTAKKKTEADDIFAQPLKAQSNAATPATSSSAAPKAEDKPAPIASLPQTFAAAKLMMPPVRKKVEPVKKPLPALDLQKLQEEKEALMRQRAAAEKTPTAAQTPAVKSVFSALGGAQRQQQTEDTSAAASATVELSPQAVAALYGSPDEEYDPAKPNDYDEFCRRRMRLKAEEEMERRRQEILARQQQATPSPEPKEDDFATKMLKKMGWKEGQGLGKEGQGMAAPLVMQKTDQKAGRIVEAQKREAPPAVGQPDPKQQRPSTPSRPPTRVLLLNNMVGKGEVDEDLEEETGEEAGKYGKLKRCVIKEFKQLPDDQAVRIFLEYEQVEAATKAFTDMNGRYFGGRVVKARFYDEDEFAKGIFDSNN